MILLLFFLTILLIPFPYKYSIYYNNQNYYIKFFFITIKSNNKKSTNKKHHITSIIKPLYRSLLSLKLKPKLIIKGDINYSFSDAMIDAIFYGSLNNIFYFFNTFLKHFLSSFNIAKLKIRPLYKTTLFFYINVKCILFISFAQIIIILIYIITNKLLKKAVTPYKGKI